MMRLMISGFAVVALAAVATLMLRSPSPSIELTAAAMPSLQELHVMAGVHKLPVQDIEDQSLVYPSAEKR
jgi:ABC-type Co2+ transport system permease subunit